MKKVVGALASVVFVFSLLLAPVTAQAALITVNDGDTFSYDAGDTYQFTGAFSDTDGVITYGAKVDLGEVFNFVVNVPAEFGLSAILTTGPNFTGTAIVTYGFPYYFPPGTVVNFPADGNYFAGQTQWLSLVIGPNELAIINSQFGGSYPVGPGTFAGSTGVTGTGSGGGGGGGGTPPPVGSVPEPNTLALLGLVFLGLGITRFQGKKLSFLKSKNNRSS